MYLSGVGQQDVWGANAAAQIFMSSSSKNTSVTAVSTVTTVDFSIAGIRTVMIINNLFFVNVELQNTKLCKLKLGEHRVDKQIDNCNLQRVTLGYFK